MRSTKTSAWSMNAATTPLKVARAFAEKAYKDAGKNLGNELPDFDANYKMLQKKCSKALNIPRIEMPVIGPRDIPVFLKHLQDNMLDVAPSYAGGTPNISNPDLSSATERLRWLSQGLEDGARSDDVIQAKVTGIPVGKLLPTQSQIWFDKVITNLIKHGTVKSGSSLLNSIIIVSKEGYILDGHHRFAQALMCDDSLRMKSLFVPLGIKLLLKLGRSYGAAVGNKPKASVNPKFQSKNGGHSMSNENSNLYDNLLVFASENPDLREAWGPICNHVHAAMQNDRTASMNKVAYSDETARFIQWVTMTKRNDMVSPKECQNFLERVFKLETKAAETQSRAGKPRFQVGDAVVINAAKHKNGATLDIYEAHNGKNGTVTKTPTEDSSLGAIKDGDVLVQFGASAPIRFPEAMKSRGTGILKDTSIDSGNYTLKTGKMLEMVYFSSKDRPPSKQQILEVEEYLEKGRQVGEDRVSYYYSGVPQKGAVNKKGQYYFQINPQQRSVRPYNSYNPTEGSLLYIGVINKRPSGWEKEYEKLIHKLQD